MKSDNFLIGSGEMVALIRSYPWITTSLGAIESWSQCLRTAVSIVLQSSAPLVMLWGDDGVMIYNDAYSEFAGARHPFLLGSKVLEGWPEVAEFNKNVMTKVLQGKTLAYQDQPLTLYRNNIPEDVWLDLNYSPIIDEAGKPAGVLAIVVETTQRVLTQQKLLEREEHLRALVTATSDVIYVMSPDWSEMGLLDGRVFVPNPGRPSGNWEWFHANIPPFEQSRVKEKIEEAISSKTIFQLEHGVNRADGSVGWTSSRAIPILDDKGDILKWFGAATDVTLRKQAEKDLISKNEELVRTNTDLDNFIYTASHDLKAPMSNIEGLLTALRNNLSDRDEIDEEREILLKFIEKSIDRFKTTILDLTEISKVQKLQEDDVEDISFAQVVEDVKISIYDEIVQSTAKIETDFSEAKTIKFSRKNLKSIVYNLLSNAVKYRDKSRITEISLKSEREGPYTILTIKDNGLGIAERNKDKIFAMFKRFHTHEEGTGIGLYIVKRIVDNAGGKIEVESQVGKGTTFKIYLKKAMD